MPIDVNHEQRRQELSEAVWRIAASSGLGAASVRRIADEAGLSVGSVRHFFPTQAALHAFAMETVAARIKERVTALSLPADPLKAAQTALSELLPLDEERRVENQVWLTFSIAALADPDLAEIRDRSYDELRSAAAYWVRQLLPAGTPRRRREVEVERLFAVIDGLAVHAATRPGSLDAPTMRAVLRRHLAGLATPGTEGPR